jgi:mono/diheme cytochrome c family protein
MAAWSSCRTSERHDPLPLTADQTMLKVLVGTQCELLVTISNGALFTPMHGFRDRLTDQQMLDVLSYIRSMVPFDVVS